MPAGKIKKEETRAEMKTECLMEQAERVPVQQPEIDEAGM